MLSCDHLLPVSYLSPRVQVPGGQDLYLMQLTLLYGPSLSQTLARKVS